MTKTLDTFDVTQAASDAATSARRMYLLCCMSSVCGQISLFYTVAKDFEVVEAVSGQQR